MLGKCQHARPTKGTTSTVSNDILMPILPSDVANAVNAFKLVYREKKRMEFLAEKITTGCARKEDMTAQASKLQFGISQVVDEALSLLNIKVNINIFLEKMLKRNIT